MGKILSRLVWLSRLHSKTTHRALVETILSALVFLEDGHGYETELEEFIFLVFWNDRCSKEVAEDLVSKIRGKRVHLSPKGIE